MHTTGSTDEVRIAAAGEAHAKLASDAEAKLIPILTRLLDAAFRLGYIKFKPAASFVLDTIRQQLGAEVVEAITLDHLQDAYIDMAASRRDQGADRPKTVVAVESKDELEVAASLTPRTEAAPYPRTKRLSQQASHGGELRAVPLPSAIRIAAKMIGAKVGKEQAVTLLTEWVKDLLSENLTSPMHRPSPEVIESVAKAMAIRAWRQDLQRAQTQNWQEPN